MKFNIEDYLHKIDSAFKDKSQKDIYMTYFMVFALIFAFSYLLFWDTSENDFLSKKSQIDSLQSRIQADETYLSANPEQKIVVLDQQIQKAQTEMLGYKDKNQYIKTKIEAISSLIYDESTWGEYVDSISQNAQKYNVRILNFYNHFVDTNASFGHVLDINLHTVGNYKNTLKFINSLEQSDLVVDIHDLEIRAQDTLNSDLNISVWGIRY